jgi:hypothetical protein
MRGDESAESIGYKLYISSQGLKLISSDRIEVGLFPSLQFSNGISARDLPLLWHANFTDAESAGDEEADIPTAEPIRYMGQAGRGYEERPDALRSGLPAVIAVQ